MSGSADRSVLARNTVWSVVGYGVQFLTPILMMPYTLTMIGAERYGMWITLFTLAAWMGFYDLGLWGSLTRDVAERQARNDRDGLRTLWATWWTYDLAGGLVSMAVAVLAAPTIVRHFSPKSDPATAVPLFIGLAAQFALSPMLRHLSGTLNGLQRLDLFNLMAITVTPLWAAGQVAVLQCGWGLQGLMLNGLFFALFQVGILLILIARQGYPLSYSPALFSGSECRRLLGFGWKVQATVVISQAFRNDRIVMGRRQMENSLITMYQFGAGIMDRLGGAIAVLSSAVLSAVSDLAARGDMVRVRILFLRGTKYHALAAFGLLGFAALFGHELLVFWLGQAHPESVVVLRIMAAGAMATAIGSCGQSVAVALGRPGWSALTGALGLGATVILYMSAGQRYDYVGLAGSVSAGLVLIQIVFMIGLRRILEFRWGEYVGNALIKPAVLTLPLAGVYAGWGALASHFPSVDTRIRAFLVLAPAFLLSAVLGWVLARALRVIDDVDLDVLKSTGRRPTA